MQVIDYLNKMGLLPIILLILAIPGGLLLTLIGAKRYLFPGVGGLVSSSFTVWMSEQKERTRIETKLEERLADLTEQLKLLVSGNWDNRRYFDEMADTMKDEHKAIMDRLDQLVTLIPKRKTD